MFASAIFSALITFVLTTVIWVSVAIYRRRKSKLPWFGFFGCLLSLVLFIPGCCAVNWAYCAVAYGDFHYATAAEMTNGLPLPAGASDITWHRSDCYQNYRFKIPEDELRRWFADYKNKFRGRPGFSEYLGKVDDEGLPAEMRNEMAKIRFERLRASFGHTGWGLPTDMKEVGSAIFAANGAGIRVYYSPGEGAAYCRTNSW